MNLAVIDLTVLLIFIGICAVISQIRQYFFPQPPKIVRIGPLTAENAEYRLRVALLRARGRHRIIHAVCADEEAFRICRLLSRDQPDAVICSRSF